MFSFKKFNFFLFLSQLYSIFFSSLLYLFLLFSPKNSFVLFFSFQKCIIISFSSGIVLFSFDFLQELCYSFLSVMNYIFLFSFFRNCLIFSCPLRFCIDIFSLKICFIVFTPSLRTLIFPAHSAVGHWAACFPVTYRLHVSKFSKNFH